MRPGAIAVAGYYPTPARLMPSIAALVNVKGPLSHSYLDPCAGGGEALEALMLAHEASRGRNPSPAPFAFEMESTRLASLRVRLEAFQRERHTYSSFGETVWHADAMLMTWRDYSPGVSVLFLNAPYDHDPEMKRLEERFLRRFVEALAPEGALLFLVPFYALSASASTLGRWFTDIACFRFPDPEFAEFKQVVLVGKRRQTPLTRPDPKSFAEVMAWSESSDAIPVLPLRPKALFHVNGQENPKEALRGVQVQRLDVRGLVSSIVPWSTTDKAGRSAPIPGVALETSVEEMLVRTYPVATPPRPAHIAAGIAAGVFNGARIIPDAADSLLPPILVKGVFDRDFRTVDTKLNKDGDVTGEVQVQQPRLVTTALDLRTKRYSTIIPSTARTESTSVEGMTMADLLHHYGRGLMSVMVSRCPVMHDASRPQDAFELPKLERPLYEAQAHAVMACVKLLGGPTATRRDRRGKSCFVLGEVGVGKSSCAVATIEQVQAKRALIMCPPHLLKSWCDQVRLVAPWIRTVVLEGPADVDALAAETGADQVIAVLSRETAKLGHAFAGVSRCGKCGAPAGDPIENARKRSRCEAARKAPVAKSPGRLVLEVAVALARVFPEDERAVQSAEGHVLPRIVEAWRKSKAADPDAWEIAAWAKARPLLGRLMAWLARSETHLGALGSLCAAHPDTKTLCGVARRLYAIENQRAARLAARRTLLLVPPCRELDEVVAELEVKYPERSYYSDAWKGFRMDHALLWSGTKPPIASHTSEGVFGGPVIQRDKSGRIAYGTLALGDRKGGLDALMVLCASTVKEGSPCGEPLFQGIPEPRRVALASYIAKRHKRLFDFLVLDEAHELGNSDASQSRAGHRLMGLGMPTMLMTGTASNGYAESLFANMWAASPKFREEFARDEKQRFIDRYGYRKQLVEKRNKDTGKVVAFGAMSDRVETVERQLGNAPGVLPLFVLKHLLPMAVTLHKADLAINVPPRAELVERIEPDGDCAKTFRGLQNSLQTAIRQDLFTPMAGKLWGAMSELPSYLDVATEDVGNTDHGEFILAYPAAVGGGVVARAKGLPASCILPKERALLAHLEAAFAEGRNVLVFAWHVRLLPRLARLINAELGEVAPILEPAKVPTSKREAWIDETVIGKKRRVLLANPVTVQTGLNNLVHFADEWWHENPAVNGTIYRQAVGRVDRIGQSKPTRIVFPVYDVPAQSLAHKLLLHKVAVSQSVDGLDAESAMAAAGIGEQDDFSSFAVGRQLYELLSGAVDSAGA